MASMSLGNIYYLIKVNNSNFKKKMRESNKQLDNFRDKAKVAGKALTAFSLIVTGAGFKLSKMASDANEIQTRFDHVFEGMEDRANEWAENFSKSFGQSRSEIKGMMAELQDTLVPMGIASDEAFELNKAMTQLAVDLSSFANVPIQQAMDDIKSGMLGMSRPMRKYGSILTENRVKTYALKTGIIETDRELTEQEKILGRVQLMLQDSTKATGDYKRTQDSFANQLRETRNLLKNIGEDLGRIVLPAFKSMLRSVKNSLEWFNELPDSVKKSVVQFLALSAAVAGVAGPMLLIIGYLPQISAGLATLSGSFAPFLIGGAIVAGIIAITTAVSNLKDEQGEELEKTKSLVDRYEELRDKTDKTVEEKKELRDISYKLGEQYNDSIEGIDKETHAYDLNTKAILENAEARNLVEMSKSVKKRIKQINDEKDAIKAQTEVLEDYNDARTMYQISPQSTQNAFEVIAETGFADMLKEDMKASDFINIDVDPKFREKLEELPQVLQNKWKLSMDVIRNYYEATINNDDAMKSNEEEVNKLNKELEKEKEILKAIDDRLNGLISETEFEEKLEKINEVTEESVNLEPVEEKTKKAKEELFNYGKAMDEFNHKMAMQGMSLEGQLSFMDEVYNKLIAKQDKLNKDIEIDMSEEDLTEAIKGTEEEIFSLREEIAQNYYDSIMENEEKAYSAGNENTTNMITTYKDALTEIEKDQRLSYDTREQLQKQFNNEIQRMEFRKEANINSYNEQMADKNSELNDNELEKKIKNLEAEKEAIKKGLLKEHGYGEEYNKKVKRLNDLYRDLEIQAEKEYTAKLAAEQDEIMEYKYNNNEISLKDYKKYLKERLAKFEEYSTEWRQINDKIKALDSIETTIDFYSQYKKGQEKKQQIEQRFEDEYKKSTMSSYDYELMLLDERYKYYSQYIDDKIALDEWYNSEKQKLIDQSYTNETTADFYGMYKGSEKSLNWLTDYLVDIKYGTEEANEAFLKWKNDLSTGLTDVIVKGESFLDVLGNIAEQIASMVITKGLTQPFTNFVLGGIGLGGTAHTGGVVTVNGIETFHTGGMVGNTPLKSDEKIIKTKVGEIILNEDQQKGLINTQKMGSAAQPNVNVEVVNNTGTPVKTRSETQFDGTRTVVRMFMEGYARNMEGVQDVFKRR